MQKIRTVNEFIGDYTVIEYELFTLCDKNCSYCYNVVETDGKRFNNSIDDVLTGLKRILDMDNKRIIIQLIGGEVLLHKNFETIIEFLYNNRHDDHKFTLFTHADHPVEFFQTRIDLLKKFGDKIRISCTLHTEGLNRKRFIENIRYVDNNFNYSNLFFFTDTNYLKDLDYIESVFDSINVMKIFPLMLDHSDSFNISYQLVNMNSKFEKYLDKMDTLYDIDDVLLPYNKGKYQMVKATQLTFTGSKCIVRAYEIDRFGDLTMSCFPDGHKPITNIFRNPSKKLLNECEITCNQKKCNMNLVNFRVELKNET